VRRWFFFGFFFLFSSFFSLIDLFVLTLNNTRRYEVGGYPTLKFFVKGEALEYQGGRSAPEIVSWLKKKTGPPAITVADVAAAHQLAKDNDVIILGFFESTTSPEALAFFNAASKGELSFVRARLLKWRVFWFFVSFLGCCTISFFKKELSIVGHHDQQRGRC
jgi:hypothetical protein